MSNTNETGIQNVPQPIDLPVMVEPVLVVELAPEPMPSVKLKAKPAVPTRNRVIRENPVHTILAWLLRFVVGVVMICNVFPLSFITAIAAFGWLQRRMQAIILRGWWRESPRRLEGTFKDFCATLGEGAPVERPRWFLRENIVKHFHKPRRSGIIGRFFGTLFDLATLPVHLLWLNFKVGVTGLFATYMLTGWACSMMLFSWYFGWYNSFHKGYEDAFLGPFFGIFGSFLLILTLIYVPMAQAHQAAAGEIAAFFQFRIVTRLIVTRLTAYTFLIAGIALASLIFDISRLFTIDENFPANKAITASEAYWILERYWFIWSIFFFFSVLMLRTVSAMIYRSAMLKAVRAGTILTSDLPPKLMFWFEKLDILPQAQIPRHPLANALRATISLKYRLFLFGAIFFFLLLFVMRFYIGYFVVFNEYRGILNHPVVQVPCIDWTPWHLVMGNDE